MNLNNICFKRNKAGELIPKTQEELEGIVDKAMKQAEMKMLFPGIENQKSFRKAFRN